MTGRTRRHRILTAPSGVVLFACLFLPGYRECGKNVAMAGDPFLAVACLLGLIIAVFAVVWARRRGELGIAIACLIVSILVAGLMVFGVALEQTFVGMNLAAVGALGLAAGALCWLLEVHGVRNVHVVVTALAALGVAGCIAVGAMSTWHPPPEREPNYGRLLVH